MCIVYVVFQFLFVTVSASVIFEDCGSAYDLYAVNIEGCGRTLPCYVTLGDDMRVNLEFYAGVRTRRTLLLRLRCSSPDCISGMVIARAEIFTDDVDFVSRNLDQDAVLQINHLNLRTPVTPERCDIDDCAIRVGAVTSITSMMSVPTSIALNQRGYLRWRIENESGRQVLCYSVLIQTQSRLQKILRQQMENITAQFDQPR